MTDLTSLVEALQKSWSIETKRGNADFDGQNPARGQCAVSALVVQDYLGGELLRVKVDGDGIDEKHHFNRLPDGTVLDTTRSQYTTPVIMTDSPPDLAADGFASAREKLLADDDTLRRYEVLKQKVVDNLKETT